jgi:uncharacterized protein with PQ loop repeat
MEDFKTIDIIVQESIRNSSYTSVVISSCVFVVYTLIIKFIDYFKSKDKNKPLIEMAAAIKESNANIVKLNSVLDKVFQESERKEISKCKNVIDIAFMAFKSRINQECQSIIIHNNIETNKDYVLDNIRKLITNEYYKLYSVLSAYEIKNVNVASKLKEEWIKELNDSVIAIIYNGQDNISRIAQLETKLLVTISSYSTYINNKTFNT